MPVSSAKPTRARTPQLSPSSRKIRGAPHIDESEYDEEVEDFDDSGEG